MMPSDAGHHWLVDIARRAGLVGSDRLIVPVATPVGDAWRSAADQLGTTPEGLLGEIADQLRIAVADLAAASPLATRLLPEKTARRFVVCPLRLSDRQIVVATADPYDLEMEQSVAFASGRTAVFELATPAQIDRALARLYARSGDPTAGFADIEHPPGIENAVEVIQEVGPDVIGSDDAEAAPVIRLTNLILQSAFRERASDVHCEPGPDGGVVRFRVDGVMRLHMRLPMVAMNRVVSRIKILARLDIADRLRPQDGRARVRIDGSELDLRISTVPTRDAEKAVIRLLRHDTSKSLDDLALGERERRTIRQMIGHRNGVVIVTGPTGSGKTTTQYACIRELASGEVNISTVEDPIEYELPGVTQMQVEPKRNFTFATALRAILRQDPDVILVGEVRDLETAEIAVRASMTGHLVLTTLHTNDAAGAVARLVDLGVERSVISSSLRGVLAQRLVRRVCPDCAEPVTEPDELLAALARKYGVAPGVRARGCDACGQSGYRGRMMVVETLVVGTAMQDLITRGATAQEIQRAAVAGGMAPMLHSALERVRAGETTLQEVERVLGEQVETPAASPTNEPRVLIVDDDPVVRLVATNLLREAGYESVAVADGESAIQALAERPDVLAVVLDLGLPGISGQDVLRHIRSTPAMASVPVVVLTASAGIETEVAVLESGADDYILKPIEPKRFGIRIKAAMRRAAAAAA